jgi:hypothetical protein
VIITGKTFLKLAMNKHCAKPSKEKEIQMMLKDKLNAEIEVKTPVGYIDIVSDSHIIEIKRVSLWKSALGQILCYAIYFPEKKKQIYLFGESKVEKQVILTACEKYDIEVIFHSDISTSELCQQLERIKI